MGRSEGDAHSRTSTATGSGSGSNMASQKRRRTLGNKGALQTTDGIVGASGSQSTRSSLFRGDAKGAAARGVREDRLRLARDEAYDFSKYPYIRSSEDFCRGVWFNKDKVQRNQLQWQKGKIRTSLMTLPLKQQSDTAVGMHETILGYCGDKKIAYPVAKAQELLQKGAEQPDIRDEIYLQLCKQLTNNPNENSRLRAWQLMLMCLGMFPPSEEFELYLTNFISKHFDVKGPSRSYARFAVMRLDTAMKSGPSMRVPTVEDIDGYRSRPEDPTPP